MNIHLREAAMAETESLEQAARRVAAALRQGDDGLSVEVAQELLAASALAYAARRQAGDTRPPFAPGHGVTATDAAIATTAILEDVNIAIFELGLWQSMSGRKA